MRLAKQHYPFSLPPLPYSYEALEPHIDTQTMHFHHDKHFKTYIDNLNKALDGQPVYQSWTLEQLLIDLNSLPESLRTAVRNNGGGVYSHDLYFDSLTPHMTPPAGALLNALSTLGDWNAALKAKALSQFGSGYAWLIQKPDGTVDILALPNQDNPLTAGLLPLLPLDVWEHAYYLKYKNARADYLDNLLQIIDWPKVAERLHIVR